MPYIEDERRKELNKGAKPENPGELNYLICKLFIWYTDIHGESYGTYNAIGGASVNAYQEFYRKVVAPYENYKAVLNGEVFN